jgi:NADH-ubiquinone oxidoreductase chain 2
LLLKVGAAPFHFWFPGVAEGLSWDNLVVLITWQKAAPFILINYTVGTSFLITTSIILSSLVGAVGGFNQVSLRKIIAFSSINHIAWMLGAFLVSEVL